MTRTIKSKAERGDLKTEITIRYTEQNAFVPHVKREMEVLKNQLYEFLRNRGYSYSQIKIK